MIVASGLLLLVALVLMVSAAAKAARPADPTSVLLEMGVSRWLAPVLVALSVAVEQLVAAALVMWPAVLEVRMVALVLFSLFAVLGATALAAGRSIECGCFGNLRRSALGWSQIIQLISVAPILVVGGRFAPEWPTASVGLAVLLMVQVAVSLALLVAGGSTWRRLRRYRNSYADTRDSIARLSQLGESGMPSPVAAP